MKQIVSSSIVVLLLLCSFQRDKIIDQSGILSYVVDLKKQTIRFYWKDENHENYRNAKGLKKALVSQEKKLVFAMNGGMYNKDGSPQGLYIEEGITKAPLDLHQEGYGNFYMQPNGVFFLTKEQQAGISTSQNFHEQKNIDYATQSGPMLLIDGKIHPKFTQGSKNLHIRNGVGILPDGKILFAMSKEKINFYDFASYFKQQGCKDALYLDGFVSRTFLPSKQWKQVDGNFGVIIAEVE